MPSQAIPATNSRPLLLTQGIYLLKLSILNYMNNLLRQFNLSTTNTNSFLQIKSADRVKIGRYVVAQKVKRINPSKK